MTNRHDLGTTKCSYPVNFLKKRFLKNWRRKQYLHTVGSKKPCDMKKISNILKRRHTNSNKKKHINSSKFTEEQFYYN